MSKRNYLTVIAVICTILLWTVQVKAQMWLEQSTSVTIRVGPILDVSDGITPEVDVDVSASDECELLKHNGAAVVDMSGVAIADVPDCNGWYNLVLTTSHTNTLGMLTYVLQDDSVFLPLWVNFMVVPSNVWDSMYGSDKLQVDTVEVSGTAQTANDMSGDIDDILVDTGTTLDTLIKDIPTVAEFEARSIVSADYVVVGDTIAGVTLVTTTTTNTDMVSAPLNAAETEAECIDALESFNLDKLLAVSTGINADADLTNIVVDKSIMSHLMTINADTSTYNATEDSREALGTDIDAVITGVNVSSIAENAITSTAIAASAIGASELATDAIGANELALNCIGNAEIADNSIDAGAIASAAIGADEIASNAIGNAEIAENAIGASEIASNAIGATEIQNFAIDNNTFASDVGSTAYATNKIALAVRKVLDEIALDKLIAVSTAINADDDLTSIIVDKSIMSHLMTIAADTSTYNASEDSHEALGIDVDTLITGVNVSGISGDTGAADNLEDFWDETNVTARMKEVWETDFATAYDSTLNMWNTDIEAVDGTAAAATTMETFYDSSTAADNIHTFWANATAYGAIEDMYDGTGYAGGTIQFEVDAIEIDGNDVTADNLHEFYGKTSSVGAYENLEDTFDGTGYAGGTIEWTVDAIEISGDSAAANALEDFWDESGAAANMKMIYITDYGTNYDTTANMWNVDVEAVDGDTTAATNMEVFWDVSTAAVALHDFWDETNAAANMKEIFITDHSTNYDGTTDRWDTDVALIDGNDVTVDNLHEFYGKTSSVGAYEEFEDMYDETGYAGGTIKIETDVQEVDGVAAAATTMETFFDVSTAADNMHDFFSNATAYGFFDDMYDGTGYAGAVALNNTTIASLSSQTVFTITAGSTDDNAYNGCIMVIEDVSTAAQKAIGLISDYTGSSKTITLAADPAIFTMANTDKVTIIPGALSSLSLTTLAAIADAIFDEDVQSAHQTAGTAGYYITRPRGRY